ncbi:hypothetical protein XENOCAPTIV_022469 [Xenoophorus captivus]|uniref:Uncharacterized protein n=1 Tax=Xenoophorus captivus TaxID=1517983 RepID=A0ABV0QWA1_9TELE
MTTIPSQGLALSSSISFSHIFISQLQSFIFAIRIALLKVARPSPSAAVFQIIITHMAFFFLLFHQIHFRMNDAENKNSNPRKTCTGTLSQNVLQGVKPISLCEANEQDSFKNAAPMQESEQVNCEKMPSKRDSERTSKRGETQSNTS